MKQTQTSHLITSRIWNSCLWIPLSAVSGNNIQKTPKTQVQVGAMGRVWPLVIPILPPGFSLSSFIGLSHWSEKAIQKAMHEEKSHGRPHRGPHVLVRSLFLSYLAFSQLCTDQVQYRWLEKARESFWLSLTQTYPLTDISWPLQKWDGPYYKETACVL